MICELRELRHVREESVRIINGVQDVVELRRRLIQLINSSLVTVPYSHPASIEREGGPEKEPWCQWEESLYEEYSMVGAVARLRSGGPAMTVLKWNMDDASMVVRWFDKEGHIHRGQFQIREVRFLWIPALESDSAKDDDDDDDDDDATGDGDSDGDGKRPNGPC
ncbi:MAG: DUF2158 domain-containing protein [Planctomycetota bacterium]|nr:DUF2158 domain-containing protein [Planctomycetota bacterium]MDA1106128.1 DUF2158 domain-containing protein [Planctomycetota bacterium]